MLELPECEENAFDGLHCPRWYGGGSCSYCGAVQPKTDCTEPNRAACPRLCIDFCNRAEEASALGVTGTCPGPAECAAICEQHPACAGKAGVKGPDHG